MELTYVYYYMELSYNLFLLINCSVLQTLSFIDDQII